VVFGEEAADGLAIDLAGGEVDETLAVLGAVFDHWECVDEVAVDGVEGARVVVRRRADGRQVDGLQIHPSSSSRRRWEGKEDLQIAMWDFSFGMFG